jgi:hypothetical protein
MLEGHPISLGEPAEYGLPSGEAPGEELGGPVRLRNCLHVLEDIRFRPG